MPQVTEANSIVCFGKNCHVIRNSNFRFSENFFENKGILYITKVVPDDFDHSAFLEKLLEVIQTDSFVIIDYHGFVDAEGDAVFVFASRGTCVASNCSRRGWIIKTEDDKKDLVDFFSAQSNHALLLNWYNIHADVRFLESSDMIPKRLVAMKIIIQDLERGVLKTD